MTPPEKERDHLTRALNAIANNINSARKISVEIKEPDETEQDKVKPVPLGPSPPMTDD